MALHEKKLPFKSRIVNIRKGEQFEPWFLHINPKGEVPVLQDGVKIIPDSGRILDYLEDNFSNGENYFCVYCKKNISFSTVDSQINEKQIKVKG